MDCSVRLSVVYSLCSEAFMTDTEKRDLYIAAAVGGIGLVIVFLYLHAGTIVSQNGQQIPSTVPAATPAQTAYNYNIAPYNPAPPLTVASPQSIGDFANSGGCCDSCGFGSTNVDVANFTTLMGTGAAA
jgi:hypothetical protein